MTKLFKYLKPFRISIIIIIGLLITQAIGDLTLPEYMSNIVNVGIQQSGIENAVPDIIRKSEMEKVTIFMSENDKKLVYSYYELLDKDKLSNDDYKRYVKDYPILKDEPLYKVKHITEKQEDEINLLMGRALLIVYGIENGDNTSFDMGFQVPDNVDPFTLLTKMPKEQLDPMLKQIKDKIEAIPEMMIIQASTLYIKNEYKAIGINIDNYQKQYIIIAGLKMIGIALFIMIAAVSVGFLSSRLAAALGRNLRYLLFSKVESFSNAEFDKFGASSLITRTTNDIQQVQHMMIMLLRIVFFAPILGIGGFLKVINTDTSMGWTVGAAVAAISIVLIGMLIFAVPKFKIVQKLIDRLNLVVRESLSGMLVIRAFNTQKHEEKKFNKANVDLTNTNLFINRAISLVYPLMMLIMNAVTILIVWVGSHQVDSGIIQVGDMMAFIQYTMQIIMSFLMISMTSMMLPRASVAASRINEVLRTKPIIVDPEEPKKFKKGFKGIIKFDNVSFKYDDADDCVLKNISFEAKPGSTTAIIGSTGSGKSTIVNLIPRFYDVTEGKIMIDGIDIRDITQHDLREKIGYVPQKGTLFSGTIGSNLKYGKADASKDDMVEAAKVAQALSFIEEKKEQFDTSIAQGGTNVSGGQKQRLSIARAIIKKAPIYIFDDTFSALDFKTDAMLRKALKKVTKESTIIIVAQRISTIMNAEQIIVLDQGKIVGVGTHKDLMRKCKVYKEIALSQLSKEELA